MLIEQYRAISEKYECSMNFENNAVLGLQLHSSYDFLLFIVVALQRCEGAQCFHFLLLLILRFVIGTCRGRPLTRVH